MIDHVVSRRVRAVGVVAGRAREPPDPYGFARGVPVRCAARPIVGPRRRPVDARAREAEDRLREEGVGGSSRPIRRAAAAGCGRRRSAVPAPIRSGTSSLLLSRDRRRLSAVISALLFLTGRDSIALVAARG